MTTKKADYIWFNGEMVPWGEAKVHVMSHALHYGTSVFEGIRCYDSHKGPVVFRHREHMQRLHDSAKIYRFPDFLMLASAFGIPGQHITRKDQVEAALDALLNSDGPYLLHVSIDEYENVWPLVPPGASNSQMLEKLS